MFDWVLNTHLPMINFPAAQLSNHVTQEPMLLQTLIFNTIKYNNVFNALPLCLFSETVDKYQKEIC